MVTAIKAHTSRYGKNGNLTKLRQIIHPSYHLTKSERTAEKKWKSQINFLQGRKYFYPRSKLQNSQDSFKKDVDKDVIFARKILRRARELAKKPKKNKKMND